MSRPIELVWQYQVRAKAVDLVNACDGRAKVRVETGGPNKTLITDRVIVECESPEHAEAVSTAFITLAQTVRVSYLPPSVEESLDAKSISEDS